MFWFHSCFFFFLNSTTEVEEPFIMRKMTKLQLCIFKADPKSTTMNHSFLTLYGLFFILYIPVNNFSVMLGQFSWVEPVLQRGKCVLIAQGHNTLCLRRGSHLQPLDLKSSTLPPSHHAPPLYGLMDTSFWFDILNLGWSIVYNEGSQVLISN